MREGGGVRSDGYGARPIVGARSAGVAAPSGLPTVNRRCRGRKADGSRCTARTAQGTQYCVGHLKQRRARSAETVPDAERAGEL